MGDTSWAGTPAALTIFTADLAASRAWYLSFLGAEPVHEDGESVVFRAGDTLVNVLHDSAVDELIAPAAAGRGVRAVYTLGVEDVDAAAEELRARGLVPLNGPMDRPWGVRTVSVQDPGGHVWELAKAG